MQLECAGNYKQGNNHVDTHAGGVDAQMPHSSGVDQAVAESGPFGAVQAGADVGGFDKGSTEQSTAHEDTAAAASALAAAAPTPGATAGDHLFACGSPELLAVAQNDAAAEPVADASSFLPFAMARGALEAQKLGCTTQSEVQAAQEDTDAIEELLKEPLPASSDEAAAALAALADGQGAQRDSGAAGAAAGQQAVPAAAAAEVASNVQAAGVAGAALSSAEGPAGAAAAVAGPPGQADNESIDEQQFVQLCASVMKELEEPEEQVPQQAFDPQGKQGAGTTIAAELAGRLNAGRHNT